MKNICFLILSWFLATAQPAFPQQQYALFSWTDPTILNPAAPVYEWLHEPKHYRVSAGLGHRVQWWGLEQSPNVSYARFGIHFGKTEKSVSGKLGFHALGEDTNPIFRRYGQVQMAATLHSEKWSLSAGFSPGIVNYAVKTDSLSALHPGDPVIFSAARNRLGFTMGAGIFWHFCPRGTTTPQQFYFAGLSLPQINQWDLSDEPGGRFSLNVVRHHVLVMGGRRAFPLSALLKGTHFLEGAVCLLRLQNAPFHADANMRAFLQIDSLFSCWVGIGGSTSLMFHVEGGIKINEDFPMKIGFSHDYSAQAYRPAFGNSWEMTISIGLSR